MRGGLGRDRTSLQTEESPDSWTVLFAAREAQEFRLQSLIACLNPRSPLSCATARDTLLKPCLHRSSRNHGQRAPTSSRQPDSQRRCTQTQGQAHGRSTRSWPSMAPISPLHSGKCPHGTPTLRGTRAFSHYYPVLPMHPLIGDRSGP